MEITICVKGRSPTPGVINVKQYSAKADVVTFVLDGVFSDKAACAIIGEKYRQSIELKDGKAVWEIAGEFTQKRGCFDMQLEVTDGETVWKSDVMLFIVSKSTSGEKLTGSGGVVGDCIMLADGFVDEGIIGYIKPEIQERAVTLCCGGSYRFTVQDCITAVWSVSGNTDTNTVINESGMLSVGENESSTTLTVTATAIDGSCSDSVSVVVDTSISVRYIFNNGECSICPVDGAIITAKQSNGTDFEFSSRIYRKRTAIVNATTDIKIPFTQNLTGYSKLRFTGGFITNYGGGYDMLSVGLYDTGNATTILTIKSGYGLYEIDIDPEKEYTALSLVSCYGEIEITKIWLMPEI